ncbi:MAG TPA: hypothetical protein VMX17_02110 [Candidatus Glassbacteria bacterium]|nr:hypothetical protein [Candidatus Glassbacteria bacterium]
MKFPTWISQVLKSGAVTVSAGDVEALKLRVENKKIDLNIVDKEVLKKALEGGTERSSLLDMLGLLKNIAKELKDEGYTITISYQGETVMTLGSEASSSFSRLVTRTNGLEINNLRRLLQMAV